MTARMVPVARTATAAAKASAARGYMLNTLERHPAPLTRRLDQAVALPLAAFPDRDGVVLGISDTNPAELRVSTALGRTVFPRSVTLVSTRVKKLRRAKQACTPLSASTLATNHDREFTVPDARSAVLYASLATEIATVARRHEVLQPVVSPITVQVVNDKGIGLQELAGVPTDRHATPAAGVRTFTDGVIEYAAVFEHHAELSSKGMVGCSEQAVAVAVLHTNSITDRVWREHLDQQLRREQGKRTYGAQTRGLIDGEGR